MDRIDVLGDTNDRFKLFTKELLAETDDIELQEIVEQAAAELDSPIALVSLVLDEVQFFKAHMGLPPDLASARGTHRDVSFCQFVVRDGDTFEVNDAVNDPRIPQHVVKEYNIQSYLGIPIKVEDNVMGSLCVLDTKKRGFSPEEHNSLKELAKLVNKRLEAITKTRRQTRLDLTEATLVPALSELSNSLKAIQDYIKESYSAGTSIRTFLNHANHLVSNKSQNEDAIRHSLEAAIKTNQNHEDLLLEIEFAASDGLACVEALEQIVMHFEAMQLSEILVAAQDLARNATKLVGGFPMPDLESDPMIYTKGNLAIAIVTNCLLLMSSELANSGSENGIDVVTHERAEFVEALFSAEDLSQSAADSVLQRLKNLMGTGHPTIEVDSMDGNIRMTFSTVKKSAHTGG